ncbi:MAG: polysaccharide deacetylase family protein [Candidatus Sulfotelmatobacter sp.]|jgi:peptidoglycan/xylan/chitin deacetylase (PgdA/CDA1 family)
MPNVFVTTSWDDEAHSGLKVAELLERSQLRGTFYVPTGRLGEDSFFSAADLRTLCAAGFEIGAHTVSHAILSDLNSQELEREVSECKAALQEILGTEIRMFCYPRGRFNANVVSALQQAGYAGARSTQMLSSSAAFGRFAMPTTLQAYPHHRSNYVRNLVRLRAAGALLKSLPDLVRFEDWLQLGKATFDRVVRNGGVWHLYGHPWEIEKLGLWPQLSEMLEYVSNRSGVQYVTNGQLLALVKGEMPVQSEKLAKTPPHSVVH